MLVKSGGLNRAEGLDPRQQLHGCDNTFSMLKSHSTRIKVSMEISLLTLAFAGHSFAKD